MSENRQLTRARILERARVLFNERGIDNVGVRDLARDLEMSPGNLSYHFTRKEDLVRALLDELRDQGAARPAAEQVESVAGLLGGLRAALLAQLDYRCLSESIVHVTRTWPELGVAYRDTERRRRRALAASVRVLVARGELRGDTTEEEIARMVATWSLVARFWLSERGLSYPTATDADAVAHYVALMAHALLPHLSPDALWAVRPFLEGTFVDAALGAGPAWDPPGEPPGQGA